jgi:hypothetical protein
MNRPDQVRHVAELLRKELGPHVPFRDLLRMAAVIVKAHREPERFLLEEGRIRYGFFSLEVDVAIGDGGWRVLDFERRLGMKFED